MSYPGIIITFVFINNLILTQFLGLCPFIGVSKNIESAVGMGIAVTFVIALSSLITWVIQYGILVPLGLGYLQTLVFILIIASMVQFVEMVIRRYAPGLYKSLGIYLPLITTNCGVLGMAIINIKQGFDPMQSFVAGFSAGIGFMLALVLMSAIRTRLDMEKVPRLLKGVPIAFISGGLMALAFMAFDRTLLVNLFGKVG